MNKSYKSIWNQSTQTWVAVSELAKSRTKQKSIRAAVTAVVALIMGLSGTNAYSASYTAGGGSSIADAKCVFQTNYLNPYNLAQAGASGGQLAALTSCGTAVGELSTAGDAGTAYGSQASASGQNTVAVGAYARATSLSSVAIGSGTLASGGNSLAMMRQAAATGSSSMAIGTASAAVGNGSLAMGQATLSSGDQAIAIGSSDGILMDDLKYTTSGQTKATGKASIAIGAGAQVTHDGSVALGQYAKTNTVISTDKMNIGSKEYTVAGNAAVGTLSIGDTGQERTLTNLAAGRVSATSTDAMNGSQLFATNTLVAEHANTLVTQKTAIDANAANIATNNASIDTHTGNITTINNTLNDIKAGAIGIVQQDAGNNDISVGGDSGGTKVNLAGVDGVRTLSGLAMATLAADSTDAVTGAQLFKTNNDVTTLNTTVNDLGDRVTEEVSTLNASITSLGDRVSNEVTTLNSSITNLGDRVTTEVNTITDSITDINTNISTIGETITNIETGEIGLVKQDADSKVITVAAAAGGVQVNLAGLDGTRTLTGLAAGDLAEDSTDAVNGAQLLATNNTVTTLDARVSNEVTTLNSSITNLGERVTTEVNTITDSITDINTNISTIGDSIANIEAGEIGLVKQDEDSKAITVAAATGGAQVSLAGLDGARTLTGLAAGDLSENSVEAVNGGQLFATNNNVMALDTRVTTEVNTINDSITDINTNISTIGDTITNIEAGEIGLVKQDADSKVITVAAATGGVQVNLAGLDGARTLTGLAAGDLAEDSTDAVNGAQLLATNNTVTTLDARVSNEVTTLNSSITNLGERVTTEVNTITDSITDINTNISTIGDSIANIEAGEIGLVKQDADSKAITVAAVTGGAQVNLAGLDGARTLTGLAAGTLSDDSSDAVNGAQLFATNANVADLDTRMADEVGLINTSITNIDGRVSTAESTITSIQTHIGDINANLASGTVGLVKQDATTKAITVAADKDGSLVDFSGSDGVRTLSGLKEGAVAEASTEAVTGSQLFATNSRVGALEQSTVQYDDETKTSVSLNKDGAAVRLQNVAAGVADTDAVNLGQLKASGMVGENGDVKRGVFYDDDSTRSAFERVTFAGANGTVLSNVAAGRVAADSTDAINGSQLASLQTTLQASISDLDGRVSDIELNGSGSGPMFDGEGDGSTEQANASGAHSVATGANAVASGKEAMALGANSAAKADNSVALGAGSVADRANTVSVGSAGNERVIANVAAGVKNTDAVNVSQLNQAVTKIDQQFTEVQSQLGNLAQGQEHLNEKIDKVDQDGRAGVAAAIAVAGLPQAYVPGKSMMAMSGGTWRGANAFAIGVSNISENGNWVVKASVAGNGRSHYGASAGVGFQW